MFKTICVIVCAIICLLFALPTTAFAAESDVRWVRVEDDEVRLYANSDSTKAICKLEKSYYLEVWGEENGMYLVSMMQNETGFPTITGYVWKMEVKACDKTPIPPYYPTETLTVSANSAQLRLSPLPSAETVITVTNTQKVSYYGEISSYGQTWYYVYYFGKFGYVTADTVTQPVIALHPTPLDSAVVAPPTTPSDPTPPTKPNPTTTNNTTEIFLIIFVAVLAVGISLALFLPGNLKKRDKDMFDSEI